MSQPHWNREQAGGLLIAGAGTIAAFQTALFSSWVDATVAADECSSGRTAEIVAWVGLVSVVLMAAVWVLARIVLNEPLKRLGNDQRLRWSISAPIVILFLGIAFGWAWLLRGGPT